MLPPQLIACTCDPFIVKIETVLVNKKCFSPENSLGFKKILQYNSYLIGCVKIFLLNVYEMVHSERLWSILVSK